MRSGTILYLILGLISAFIILFDQISKIIVMNNMNVGQTITVIPNLLKFHFVRNKGMAFSFLSDSTPLLAVISFVASAVLLYFMIKYSKKDKLLRSISIAFIFAGCVGNLIDRFLTVVGTYNGVIDFIELYIGNWNVVGATFNIADSFLVIGAIMIIIDLIFFEGMFEKKEKNDSKNVEEKENE